MSQPGLWSSTGWSQKGLWTKATPSIKWSRNDTKGGSKNLTVYEATKVQCNLCGVEVSLKKLEHHRNLRCRACGHHHRHHGTLEYCGSCIKQCKKCGPFHGRLRSIQVQGRQRCGCGHYHANGRICNSFTDLSPSISTSLPREHHSDSDSTVQSMASNQNVFFGGNNNSSVAKGGGKESSQRVPADNFSSPVATSPLPLRSSSLVGSPSRSRLPTPFPRHVSTSQDYAQSKTAPRTTMRTTSTTGPGSLFNKSGTPPPLGTRPPSDDAVSPPSPARELPIHKSWSMGDSWERANVDRYAGLMSKTSSLQAFHPAVLQRDLVDKASVGEHSLASPWIPHQASPIHGLPNPFPCHADASRSNARSRTAPRSSVMRPTSPNMRLSDPLRSRSSTPPPPGTISPPPPGSKTAGLSTLNPDSNRAASADISLSLETPFTLPTRATGRSSPSKVGDKSQSVSQEKFNSGSATLSSATAHMASVRSSRDPRLRKQAMLRQSNEASLFDPTRSGKLSCISKVVKKMSFVEYQAREANGKGTGGGKEKEKSDGKAMQDDVEVQASAAPGQAMSKGRICHEGSKSGENCLKNMEDASNLKYGTKQTAAEENFEVPGCEEIDCEAGCEARAKRLLEELTQLSIYMEEEKEKSRRLHQENESLDIELELINEKLK